MADEFILIMLIFNAFDFISEGVPKMERPSQRARGITVFLRNISSVTARHNLD